jgi:hypothetical protein
VESVKASAFTGSKLPGQDHEQIPRRLSSCRGDLCGRPEPPAISVFCLAASKGNSPSLAPAEAGFQGNADQVEIHYFCKVKFIKINELYFQFASMATYSAFP